MSIIEYANSELTLAGYFSEDADVYDRAIADDALEVLEVLANQGHSGTSIGFIMATVNQLVKFLPLTPLTGEDHEWMEVGEGTWQSKRMPNLFKTAEAGAYVMDHFIFRTPDGCCYTSKDSRKSVTFPYMPEPCEYVDVPE